MHFYQTNMSFNEELRLPDDLYTDSMRTATTFSYTWRMTLNVGRVSKVNFFFLSEGYFVVYQDIAFTLL